MANTKSAEKALRQSKKREARNNALKAKVKSLLRMIKTNKANPDILKENYKQLQSTLDKAAKVNAIHKNKAARLKARALKLAHAKSGNTKSSKSKSNASGTGTKSS